MKATYKVIDYKVEKLDTERVVAYISVDVKVGKYSFKLPYCLDMTKTDIDMKYFKERLTRDIIIEVKKRSRIEPIELLKNKEFTIDINVDSKGR